jgi:ATP-dependent protease ClpP protease subunit
MSVSAAAVSERRGRPGRAASRAAAGKTGVLRRDPRVRVFEDMDDADFFSDRVQHLYLYNVISTESVTRLKAQIRAANRDRASDGDGERARERVRSAPKPIVVHVNSMGGSMSAGITMMSVLAESQLPICVLVDGVSASAATYMSLLAPYRVMTAHSVTLVHEWRTIGAYDENRASDIRFFLENTSEMQDTIVKLMLGRTRATRAQLVELMSRDKYLDAAACKALGFVDRVVAPWARARPAAAPNANANVNANVNAGALASTPSDVRALLRRPDANHVQVGLLEGEDIDSGDVLTKQGYGLSNVLLLDRLLETDPRSRALLRPVVVHFSSVDNDASTAVDVWRHVFPMVARLGALASPVVGVIDNQVQLHGLLPLLFCSRRVMYESARVVMHIMYAVQKFWMLQDIVDNTHLLLGQVRAVLRERTRLPAEIIDNLHRRRTVLSAADCLRYGVVDVVLPVLE